MAASYQTGTATSPTNLLQTLVTWLVAQGWTQDQSAADGSGWRAHLHKGALYVNLRAAANESVWNYNNGSGYGIGLYLGDGYSGASNWRSQSGGPIQNGTSNTIGAGMLLNSGSIVAYDFFDDGADHITVVVEKSPGVFVHMGWGPSLVKHGYTFDSWYFYGSASSYYNTSPITAGMPGASVTSHAPYSHSILDGSNNIHSSAFFRVDSGTFSGRWVGIGTGTGTDDGYTGKFARAALNQSVLSELTLGSVVHPNYSWIDDRGWQSSNVRTLLLPLLAFIQTASGRWAFTGHPPTVFFAAGVGHGFAARGIYAEGGVNYMLYPNFAVKKAA